LLLVLVFECPGLTVPGVVVIVTTGQESIADVFNRTGYGAGSISAVDFYTSGDDHNYTWNGKSWALKNQD
jgi:hypothetical protein